MREKVSPFAELRRRRMVTIVAHNAEVIEKMIPKVRNAWTCHGCRAALGRTVGQEPVDAMPQARIEDWICQNQIVLRSISSSMLPRSRERTIKATNFISDKACFRHRSV